MVFSFQWVCCDFVLTDWVVFHFAFIFHPVKRIFSAFFSSFPCLLLSVWISAPKQWLLCIAGLQLPVLQRPELNLLDGKLGSNLSHVSGQHLEPWVGQSGEVVGVGKYPRKGKSENRLYFFTWLALCFFWPALGSSMPLAGSSLLLGISCMKFCFASVLQRAWHRCCSELQKLVGWSWCV